MQIDSPKFPQKLFPETHRYVGAHWVSKDGEKPVLRCNRCGAPVLTSDLHGYSYQCFACDEDLYAVETHVGEPYTQDEIDALLEDVWVCMCLDEKQEVQSHD